MQFILLVTLSLLFLLNFYRRSRTAVATVGNLLFAVGGFDSTNDLASAECFNPQINKVIVP